MNIILFGGGFDPFHLGHLNMAKFALKKLSGRVIIIPARISVWKNESLNSDDKIELIKLAIQNEKDMEISLFEINSEKPTTYSIDTVKFFKKLYPNDNLYLLIGSDQVNEFHRWKEALEISKICQIIYFPRPGFQINNDNIKQFNILELNPVVEFDASSTDIRNLKRLPLTKEEIFYIEERNLYYMNKVKSFLDEHRFNHSKQVARLAYEIALTNNLSNPDKYYIAGLLHDIGKNISKDESYDIIDKYYNEYKDINPTLIHQFIGEYLAINQFDITDEDILKAIKYHATGNKNMNSIGMVVYAADKIEPTRGFDSSELISAMKKDYKSGFVEVLKANLEYFKAKHIDYNNELTYKCLSYYLDIN